MFEFTTNFLKHFSLWFRWRGTDFYWLRQIKLLDSFKHKRNFQSEAALH